MTTAEEIKAKLDIVEVIREYVPSLKANGVNFTALSPFNREKTPSFVVSPEKQIWHCFSSGKGGDIFTFVMEMEGIDFVEALRLLASKAGVILKKQNPQLTSQRNKVLDILESASSYYYSNLLNSPQAQSARDYLQERGITREVIDKWQIGYAQEDWNDLINYLINHNFQAEDIFAAGLSIKKQGTNRVYNRFRHRIMFPLNNVNGSVVGFTGRIMPGADKDQGKYINSPQTIVYDKSSLLFGLDKAKMSIKNQGYAIIMEGQMDVITAHQFGFTNTIAASGTALTIEQVKLIDRYTDNIIFALDADSAGQQATDKGEAVVRQFDTKIIEAKDKFGQVRKYIDPSQSYKKNIKVLVLPAGQDPDDYIRQDKEGWIKSLKQAKPIMQYYFDKAIVGLDLSKLEHKRQVSKILLPVISKLPNVVDKDFWLKKLSSLVDVDSKFLYEALTQYEEKNPVINKQTFSDSESVVAKKPKNRSELLSEALLALVLKFPVHLKYILDYLTPEQLVGEDLKVIYKNLILYYNESVSNQDSNLDSFVLNYTSFISWLDKNSQIKDVHKQLLNKLFIIAEKDFYDYSPATANQEIRQIARILKQYYLNERLKVITQLIAELEQEQSETNNKLELRSLLEEFNNLTEEIRKLNQ